MNPVLARVLYLFFVLVAISPAAFAADGRFIGHVDARFLDPPDDRNMRLLKSFEYVDSRGLSWFVPPNTIIDGASIPRIFWTIIGGPFEGLYRNASVIHDYFCETRTRRSADVHRVFYEAMLASGVGPNKAFLMYQGVINFGPQWEDPKIDPVCQSPRKPEDLAKCSRNAARPAQFTPTLDRKSLDKFIREVEGKADANDIEILRQEAERLQ